MIPRIVLATILAALGILQSPQASKGKPTITPYEDKDAYEVYAALLPHVDPWSSSIETQIVIQREITGWDECTRDSLEIKLGRKYRKVWEPVLEDYARMCRSSWQLLPRFPIKNPIVLLPEQDESTAANKEWSWDAFYAKYPKARGYVSLSAVGFNAKKDKALVHAWFGCGLLCGRGTYHFLEKKNGKWQPAEVKGEWPMMVS
ncbi:MAG: hypothetical protein M1453_12465 [Acidobacteria bacterium]|nr:hypothetical protein [Acidobacteriota bacterium]MCL5288792.1 hypothetical protein [Acidobacteriota bacterium]